MQKHLPLLKETLQFMVQQLRSDDKLCIITFDHEVSSSPSPLGTHTLCFKLCYAQMLKKCTNYALFSDLLCYLDIMMCIGMFCDSRSLRDLGIPRLRVIPWNSVHSVEYMKHTGTGNNRECLLLTRC